MYATFGMGITSESTLESNLWNSFYTSLLKVDMLEKSCLVGYADVVTLVTGSTVEQAQSWLGILMRNFAWLDPSAEKAEVVILIKNSPDPIIYIDW